MSDPTSGPPAPETLWWDFFGPRARGTAEHFATHVRELIARDKLEPWPVGVDSKPGQASCWCTASGPQLEALAAALRPRRRTAGRAPGG